MLNVKLIEERFRREIEDIVIYEVQYYIKDSQVWENLCERLGEYIDLFYSKYNIEWKVTAGRYGTGEIRMDFNEDPPFSLAYMIDLNIYRNTRLGVDFR